MMGVANVLLVLLGAALGFLIAWLLVRPNAAVLNSRLSALQQDLVAARDDASKFTQLNSQLRVEMARLDEIVAGERRANEEKSALLNQMKQEMRDGFEALSAQALRDNNQTFLELAQETLGKFQSKAKGDLDLRQQAVENLVAPIGESLKKVDEQIREIEKARNHAYGTLSEQVRSMVETQEKLQSETGNLVRALRTPSVRGQWGEIQLHRVVEMAGMLAYCDFVEQKTITGDTGRLRPDLIVKLAGGKSIVVDVKTPLQAYLEAAESTDEGSRRQKLQEHARQVRSHMNQLSSKGYWEQFESSPEFVVMFLPGEAFFSASLEQDPALIESGVGQRVILASPTTLIALLKAVAYGWNQENLARNAQKISDLGKELHERLRLLGGHIKKVGKGLDQAVESYNSAVGSLESRVMVSARKFAELGAVAGEIAELDQIETTTRNLTLDFDDPDNTDSSISTEPSLLEEDVSQNRKSLPASKASD